MTTQLWVGLADADQGFPRSVTPVTAVPGWRGASSPPARDCCLLLPYKGPRSWGPGQELEVGDCFAPLLRWVRSWWVPTGGRELAQEPLVLAADPTSKQDDLVALVISVVYRQHAIPVAWHIVGAQERESWIDHFCRLLRQLAPAVPATVPVHVLCDQGLCSRDLWAQIVALGWHPCLRYPPHVTFQPRGQTPRVPVRTLIAGPGDLWVGIGRAFRDQPLAGTLMVLHAYGQAQPWVLLTDTPVAQTEPTLYACRNWIEQGFRGLKTVGWKWHKTRRRDPVRRLPPGRLRRPPAELDAAHQDALPPRRHSLLQQGVATLQQAYCCVAISGPACGCDLPWLRLQHAPAPAEPRRHLNLPAPSARDPHRTPSTPRPPRSSAQRGSPYRHFCPLWAFLPSNCR